MESLVDPQCVKDFNKTIIDLFNILSMKASGATRQAEVARLRRLYSAFKHEVGTKEVIARLAPRLVRKKDIILTKNATQMMSAETRAELVVSSPDEVVLSLYDFCVTTYDVCSTAERDHIWSIVLDMYKACLACAIHWHLPLVP